MQLASCISQFTKAVFLCHLLSPPELWDNIRRHTIFVPDDVFGLLEHA
jgi:hypothetical protein